MGELCAHAAGSTRRAFQLMRSDPRPPEDGTHYRLRGTLAIREFAGRTLEQWQVKVSGAGRIWCLPDDEKHTVMTVVLIRRLRVRSPDAPPVRSSTGREATPALNPASLTRVAYRSGWRDFFPANRAVPLLRQARRR